MGIDVASPEIDRGSEQQTPYNQLAEYLKAKGTVTERELDGNHRKFLELSRKGVLRTHLSLPIIGDTDYKGILFKISRDAEDSNSDITIEITNRKATEKNEKKDLNYTPTTITIPTSESKKGTVVIEHPNDMWRWLGLNRKIWKDGSDQESYTTESVEEVQKVVGSFTKLFPAWEEDTDAPFYSERVVEDPKITRRSFLRLLSTGAKLAVVDSVLAHIPMGPSITKGFWERLETLTIGVPPEEWKKYIEKDMGVTLISPSTGTVELFFRKRKFNILEWDTPSLKILYSTLADLPEHFHRGKRISVALVDQSIFLPTNIYAKVTEGGIVTPGGYCVCANPDNQLVVLNKPSMGQTFFESGGARRLITHEFTHKVTSPNLQHYVDSILLPIGISRPEQLGDVFKIPVAVRTLTLGALGHQGYGATNFSEFFSVAAEYYIKGKGVFMRSYSLFVGLDNAEKLYGGMKTEIFAGKEY